MKTDQLKHQLLSYVNKPLLDHYGSGSTIGIKAKSFEKLEVKFDTNREGIWEIASELIDNHELVYYNVDITLFHTTNK